MAESSTFVVSAGRALVGRMRVPGDKSISHRAIMLGSIAEGTTDVSGFLEGEDALATLRVFRALGVSIEGPAQGQVSIRGVGLRGLSLPSAPLDLGNSGTGMRLLAGLLAGQRFSTELTGDDSLRRRPMRRISDPLARMGARIETSTTGTPPLRIEGVPGGLSPLRYQMPVVSAQVKSCLLLAGLYANGTVCITEPAPTRDHTERMLVGFGYRLDRTQQTVCLEGGGTLMGTSIEVPGDFSSAAFFLVAASISAGSDLIIERVGVNPTRTGALEILGMMGADISLENQHEAGGEPVADLHVRASGLHGIRIPERLVALAIDEFPALFVAAACAEGCTTLTGAEELRVKESDRIEAMARALSALGVSAHPTADGMVIRGGTIGGGEVDSLGDHRIAMALAVAGVRADAPICVQDCLNVDTSFPGFVGTARQAGLNIRVERG